MKIRTDFVTNSSSSSFITEKTANFVGIKSNGEHILLSFESRKGLFQMVPDSFNKFATTYYESKGTWPSASSLLNSIIEGKKSSVKDAYMEYLGITKLIPEKVYLISFSLGFGESQGEDFRNESSYFDHCFHPALSKEKGFNWPWELFIENYITYTQAVADNHKYYYWQICSIDPPSISTKEWFYKYYCAYECPELPFEPMKQRLIQGGFTDDLVKDMEGKLKILYYSSGTQKNDMLVYCEGEVTLENIKIFLQGDITEVNEIKDNFEEITATAKNIEQVNMVLAQTAPKYNEIIEKEDQPKMFEKMISGIYEEEPAKQTTRKNLIKVRFQDGRTYNYYCKFMVRLGDKVFVDGKRAGEPGMVVEIVTKTLTGKAAANTLYVQKAFCIKTKE